MTSETLNGNQILYGECEAKSGYYIPETGGLA